MVLSETPEVKRTVSEILKGLSEDLADAVAKADPYVVRVEARNRLPASGVVWSRDGVIVTTHHVIERDDNIKVGLANGRTAAATLVGRDPSTDLAVLRADADGLPEPDWAEPEAGCSPPTGSSALGARAGAPGAAAISTAISRPTS